MKTNLKILFAIFILFVSFPAVNSFQYEVEPLKNTINRDEAATFKLTITNTLEVDDYFTISTRDVNWVLTSTPPSSNIAPGISNVFEVQLIPKSTLNDGNIYLVPVKVKSEKTQTYFEEGKKFAIFLGTGVNGSYQATVTPSVVIDKVVDPREPLSVKILLRNRNQKDIKDLEVKMAGGTEIERSYTTNLLPLEEKTNEILFRIDPYTLPGKRTLTLNLIYDNMSIGESSTEYEILGYINMQEKSSRSTGFLGLKEDYVFEIYNNGNEKGIAEHKFTITFFKRLFTRFDPEATKEKGADGSVYYSVKKEIGSKETFTIHTTTDYRLLASIIFLLIISTILYFVFRSPVIIYKNAEPIGKMTPEGLSEVKVRLYLKNRSGKQVSNIRVTDVIPTIADIKKSTHVGSMDPVNLSKGKKGTIARWEFASLEPYEERVIAYKIESKLKLVGGIRLPMAKARFESKKGKERVTYSNHVNLIHNFIESEEEATSKKQKK
jgi:hypothetical protein